jgi:hypothetical protein
MRNPKALAATERAAATLFENPEITAMGAICEILQELPDEAARLRVMRWSFARFTEEFKRPLSDSRPQPAAPSRVERAPASLATVVLQYQSADSQYESPEAILHPQDVEDFGSQISELNDLFPSAPRLKLAR